MTLRFFVCGLILASLTACEGEPQTLTSSRQLQQEAGADDAQAGTDPKTVATVDVSAKFDRTPVRGHDNVGVVYYRVDISNPTPNILSVGAVYVQFEDALKIAIRKCRLPGSDVSPYRHTPIQVDPGTTFSASSSCEFPISQMDGVKQIVSVVNFRYAGQKVQKETTAHTLVQN